jgi:hypothetical protein
MAHTRCLDVDEDLAAAGRQQLDVLDGQGRSGFTEHCGAHGTLLSMGIGVGGRCPAASVGFAQDVGAAGPDKEVEVGSGVRLIHVRHVQLHLRHSMYQDISDSPVVGVQRPRGRRLLT